MAGATAMELSCITRPLGGMSMSMSMSMSSALLASRALIAAVATGEGERWGLADHVRYLFMLAVWINVWVLRVVMDFFSWSTAAIPSPEAVVDLLAGGGVGTSSALVVHGGYGDVAVRTSATAIGRALSHLLGILNEIPATSRKYEVVFSMADKILDDNLHDGDDVLVDVNRAVLSAAFSRTCELLRRALRRSETAASATWPSRVLRLLPMGPRLAACYDAVRVCFDSLLPPSGTGRWRAARPVGRLDAGEWLEAEKLANELLWITNKMRLSSAAGKAAVWWAYASGLATLSLTAHPRVQGPVIKVTAVLLRELAGGEWAVPQEVRFRIVTVWLPLLCYGSSGVTSPVLTGFERWEVERALEELIQGLPLEDQEVVLGNWVEDFAASDSDWPNLQRCFERWCWNARKLLP